MWLPVDPVDAATSRQLVAGSHTGRRYLLQTFLDQQVRWFPEGALAELPDIDADPGRFRILRWALQPGDTVFVHMLTVRGAPGVADPHRCRVWSVRFLGEDMVHRPRPGRTSPPFPVPDDELRVGAPLGHRLFLVLWRRSGTL